MNLFVPPPSHPPTYDPNSTCQTPYLIAKATNSTACLELLREKHGRPTPEEESFNPNGVSAAVTLTGGTLEKNAAGVAFTVSGETNPEGPAVFPVGQVGQVPGPAT